MRCASSRTSPSDCRQIGHRRSSGSSASAACSPAYCPSHAHGEVTGGDADRARAAHRAPASCPRRSWRSRRPPASWNAPLEARRIAAHLEVALLRRLGQAVHLGHQRAASVSRNVMKARPNSSCSDRTVDRRPPCRPPRLAWPWSASVRCASTILIERRLPRRRFRPETPQSARLIEATDGHGTAPPRPCARSGRATRAPSHCARRHDEHGEDHSASIGRGARHAVRDWRPHRLLPCGARRSARPSSCPGSPTRTAQVRVADLHRHFGQAQPAYDRPCPRSMPRHGRGKRARQRRRHRMRCPVAPLADQRLHRRCRPRAESPPDSRRSAGRWMRRRACRPRGSIDARLCQHPITVPSRSRTGAEKPITADASAPYTARTSASDMGCREMTVPLATVLAGSLKAICVVKSPLMHARNQARFGVVRLPYRAADSTGDPWASAIVHRDEAALRIHDHRDRVDVVRIHVGVDALGDAVVAHCVVRRTSARRSSTTSFNPNAWTSP
jgi:hypothetical protein